MYGTAQLNGIPKRLEGKWCRTRKSFCRRSFRKSKADPSGKEHPRDDKLKAFLRTQSETAARSMQVVLVDDAGLHHELYAQQFGNVLERIARDGDEVGPLPCFDGAQLIRPAEQFRGDACSGLDGLHR